MSVTRRVLLAGLSGGLACAATPAFAAPAFTMESVTLYLPEELFAQRTGSDVGPLGRYINLLKVQAAGVFEAEPRGRGASGALVVMVKRGQRARVWVVTGEPLPDTLVTKLKAQLETVTPVKVENGPILFGLAFSAWGGGRKPPYAPMAIPAEWFALFPPEGGALDDSLMAKVWPN